jgi:hypothetical protein
MARICLALLCAFFAVLTVASAQVQLERSLLFVDKSSAKGHLWEANSSAIENQGFLFPSASGAVGQVVKVQSVSSGSATFVWSTPTGSLAGLSSVTASDASDNTSWAVGPNIAVTAGSSYRIVGELGVYRETSGGGASDAIYVGLRDMPANTYAEFTVECLNCPAGTSPVSAFRSGTATNVPDQAGPNKLEFDPGGGTDYLGAANTFYYRLEGIVRPVTSGNVYFGFNKSGNSNTTKLVTGSYWAVIEIE